MKSKKANLFQRYLECTLLVWVAVAGDNLARANPLVLRHDVIGTVLQVAPSELAVPVGIPGSILVSLTSGGGGREPRFDELASQTYVEAVLRGPGFDTPYQLLGLPNEPLMLPPLAVVGTYRIENIRLMDISTHQVLLEGTPDHVPVNVFREVLISRVDSRPLTYDEMVERGIYLDESNFDVVEFEASILIEGQPVEVRFPVVQPNYNNAVEIFRSREEVDALARETNRAIQESFELPEPLQLPGLDLQLAGINFEPVVDNNDPEGGRPPPVPALVVFPGQVAFLNSFFSVQVYTANAAPIGSGLSVHSLTAEAVLPDAASDNAPLRLARIEGGQSTIRAIRSTGLDGQPGTEDDDGRLNPGQTGVGEFVVEGRKPGLHRMSFKLRGILDGFAAGEVPIEGQAEGAVLVRNPNFSITFSHPRATLAGEPFEASVTVLNTSDVPAHEVSVRLPSGNIAGATLTSTTSEVVMLGNMAPGESRTARFDLVAGVTGRVSFVNLSADDGSSGRVELRLAVDERGVELSGESIAFPEWTRALPEPVRRAADRVLGQALAVSRAARLPPGVRPIPRELVVHRAVELASAGQRYYLRTRTNISEAERLEALRDVLLDLILAWHGGERRDLGFDQILRETDAGRAFGQAIEDALGGPPSGTLASEWVLGRATDLAGRYEEWSWAFASDAAVKPSFEVNALRSTPQEQSLCESGAYGGGVLARDLRGRPGDRVILYEVPPGGASSTAYYLESHAGSTLQLSFTLSSVSDARSCFRYALEGSTDEVQVDRGCDGTVDTTLSATVQTLSETPPQILAVAHDPSAHIARPRDYCGPHPLYERLGLSPRPVQNYGTTFLILFSKPVTAESANQAAHYQLDNGAPMTGVQLQPGGRVAIANSRLGVRSGAAYQRQLITHGVVDRGGLEVPHTSHLVETGLADADGVTVRGRVLAATGEPVPGIPVTLIMKEMAGRAICEPVEVPVSQVMSDSEGRFQFDYVMGGLNGFRVSATDIRGVDPLVRDYLLAVSNPQGSELEMLRGLLDERGIHFENDTAEELKGSDLTEVDPLVKAFLEAGNDLAKIDGTLLQSLLNERGISFGRDSTGLPDVNRVFFNDRVDLHSSRIGSVIPVTLQFRGRGEVQGTVYRPDGVTPAGDEVVVLYPDLDSEDPPHFVRTQADGRFLFRGVALGNFSLSVSSPFGAALQNGRLDAPQEITTIDLTLVSPDIPMGDLEGVVYEADGITTHSGGWAVLKGGPWTEVDGQGSFTFRDLPAGDYEVVAVSADRVSQGRRNVQVQGATTQFVTVTLNGFAEVRGVVERASGARVAGALVGAPGARAMTDADGVFVLPTVPIGRQKIESFQDATQDPTVEVSRYGEASLLVAPGSNFVRIQLESVGRIEGVVRDANGQRVPDVRVAIPTDGGFYWKEADASGRYVLNRLKLGRRLIVAPAPPVIDVDGAVDELLSAVSNPAALTADSPEILDALERIRMFVSGERPDEARATAFGFTKPELLTDDQVISDADITFVGTGTVSGRVLNHQGVPIGTTVEVWSVGRTSRGQPELKRLRTVKSDAVTGAFSVSGVRIGEYAVHASSPFYTDRPSVRGATRIDAPNVEGIELRFQPPGETYAIGGTVFQDGVPVSGASVRVMALDLAVITSNTEGRYRSPQQLRPGLYFVEATGPSGRVGEVAVTVGTSSVAKGDIHLLPRDSALRVRVLDFAQSPVEGAEVVVNRGSYPSGRVTGSPAPLTDASGWVSLSGIYAGSYAIEGCAVVEQARFCGRVGLDLSPQATQTATLTLGPHGTLSGHVYDVEDTPVAFARVRVGTIGYTHTSTEGAFELSGVPLGRHTVVAYNQVTGRYASEEGELRFHDDHLMLTLRELPLGLVSGRVIDSEGMSYVPAAEVSLDSQDPHTPVFRVLSDAAGFYRVAGVPPGTYQVGATAVGLDGQWTTGRNDGRMPEQGGEVVTDIYLPPTGSLDLTVQTSTGGVESRAFVAYGSGSAQTDTSGFLRVTGLPVGKVMVEVRSSRPGRDSLRATYELEIPGRAETLTATVQTPGVGVVVATVRDSNGPIANASVTLEETGALQLTDAQGEVRFENVQLGTVQLEASSGAFRARNSGVLSTEGEQLALDLWLSTPSTVQGRLLRPTAPPEIVARNQVSLSFTDSAGEEVSLLQRTSDFGTFSFEGLTAGPFTIEVVDPIWGGRLIYMGSIQEGVTVDLGDLLLDETDPSIVEVFPADGQTEAPVDQEIWIRFSEPMDPIYPDAGGAYLIAEGASSPAPVTLSWRDNGTVLGLQPTVHLQGNTRYTLVLTIREVLNGSASVIGRGPRDLAGRSLPVSSLTTFVTRDTIAPELLSFSPAQNEAQVDPSAVVRISFSEPMAATSFGFSLTDLTTQQAVPGTLTVSSNLNRQVMVFVPAQALLLNRSYRADLSAATDLAGNHVLALPFSHTFATIDTVGPRLVGLELVGATSVVDGGVTTFRAQLESPEPQVVAEMTTDLRSYFRSADGHLDVSLPISGATVEVRARAYDAWGNAGPWFSQSYTTTTNTPPSIALETPIPTIRTGASFTLTAVATDDGGLAQQTMTTRGVYGGQASVQGNEVLSLSGVVSSTIGPGRNLIVELSATDTSSAVGTNSVSLPVEDGVSPVVRIAVQDPRPNYTGGETVRFDVTGEDAFGIVQVEVREGVVWSPPELIDATPTWSQTYTVTLPMATSGNSTYRFGVRVADAAGRVALAESPALTIQDVTPPQVTTIIPADDAFPVATSAVVTARFSEPITGMTTSNFVLRETNGPIVTSSLTVSSDRFEAILEPHAALTEGAIYEVQLASSIVDDAGNMLSPFQSTFVTSSSNPVAPRLMGQFPADAATNVGLRPAIQFFTEAAIAHVPTDGLVLREAGTQASVPLSVRTTVREGRFVLEAQPTAHLRSQTQYETLLSGLITGESSLRILDESGQLFDSLNFGFTTTSRGTRRTPPLRLIVRGSVRDAGASWGTLRTPSLRLMVRTSVPPVNTPRGLLQSNTLQLLIRRDTGPTDNYGARVAPEHVRLCVGTCP